MNATPETPSSQQLLVRKTIHVAASPARAFAVFTEKMGAWWPLASHKIGKVVAEDARIEPRVGGRWYERGVDGSECTWGHVRVFEPPSRLVLSWELSADFQHDPAIQTEVEVRFVADGAGTRVELEHRLLEHYGARGVEMRGVFDSQGGWASLLALFGAHAAEA